MKPRRLLLLALGVAVLAAVWGFRAHSLVPGAFSAHMTMHMAVVAVAAPLLAAALANGPYDPVPRAPALFAPVPASVVELAVVWGWHAPALHHLARGSAAGLALEQATFLGSALFVWLASLGGGAARGGNRAGAGVLALLLTSMHMTLLGALLALPTRALYAHAARPGAHHALADQHLGGGIMLIAGAIAYLAGALFLAAAMLRRRRVPA